MGLLTQRLRLNRGTRLGSSAGRDRGESERWSGGIAQLDTGALSHECLARDGTVDEHAVATLAAHGPTGWGGGHQQVRTRHEGVDDLNVAVRCPSHGEGSGEGVRFQRGLGRERAHDECGNGQGAVLPGRVSWDSRHDTAVSMSPLKVSTPQCDVGYVQSRCDRWRGSTRCVVPFGCGVIAVLLRPYCGLGGERFGNWPEVAMRNRPHVRIDVHP